MEDKQFRGHVIVLPYPSQGHINPLLQFAKRLASKGVKATLATTRYTVGSICAPRIGVEAISDGFDQGGYSQAGDVEFYLKPLSEECMEWLETKPSQSVVYISFGSMVSLTEEEMEEIPGGLSESGLHYLWIVRESEQKKLPKWFLEYSNKDKGMVVTWCNQLEMLSHPAVGCFVTHCGWNSTLEGLSLGVPKWADQLTDAKFVKEIWGIGVRAEEDEELIKCLKQVMEGDMSKEIKRNANKWKELAKKAIREGGSSDECIDEFI
ncbi:hypothetical protein GQ457_10G025460 [Hibiscus cannabinus]